MPARFSSVAPTCSVSSSKLVFTLTSSEFAFGQRSLKLEVRIRAERPQRQPARFAQLAADAGEIRDYRLRGYDGAVQIGSDVGRVVQHGGELVCQRKNSRQRTLHLRDHRLQLVGNRRCLHGAQPGSVVARLEDFVAVHASVPRRDDAVAVDLVVEDVNGVGFKRALASSWLLVGSSTASTAS